MNNNSSFQEVYPFTTEAISGYFPLLNFKDKEVFTVGSSLDQAFNALLMGAKNVVVYDINQNVLPFYKLKKECILNMEPKKMYKEIVNTKEVPISSDIFPYNSLVKMNPYMSSKEKYMLLRERLTNEDSIKIVNGNIFSMDSLDENTKFDTMILSNILQYLEFFSNEPYELLKTSFPKWVNHLNKDGILQFIYLYGYSANDINNNNHSIACYNIGNVCDALNGNILQMGSFDDLGTTDSIITYTKKR